MSISHLSLRDFAHTSFDDFANLIDANLSHQFVPMHFALVLGLGFLAVAEGECWMWVCPARIHTPKPLAFTPCPLSLVLSTFSRLRLRGFAALLLFLPACTYACISHKRRDGALSP